MAGDNSAAPLIEVSGQGVHLYSGQQIVTSGDGALLPAGLSVGKVFWDGSDFRAGLYADAGHSDDVRVLDLKLPAEGLPSVSARDLPVSAAGLAPLTPPPPKITQPASQPAASATAPSPAPATGHPSTAESSPAPKLKAQSQPSEPATDQSPDDQ
jgi:rod shape-determining protein MreC